MPKQSEPISVRILDREFRINCSEEERDDLLDAARFLDLRLRDARDRGPNLNMEKLAIMTALNISDSLLKAERELAQRSEQVDQRLDLLTDRLSRHLDAGAAER